MTSELAQARQLTVLVAIAAIPNRTAVCNQNVSALYTLVLFGELPMIRGVR